MLALLLGACTTAPAPRRPVPAPEACKEPLYVELTREHPDSLSDRAWERLQQLEAHCRAERAEQTDEPAFLEAGHHRAMWLWMPAMMLFGGMMWLMMGAS
jgi:hypothetical protein